MHALLRSRIGLWAHELLDIKAGTAGALDKCKQNLFLKPLVVTGACISFCYFLMTCFTMCGLGPDREKQNYAKKSHFCLMQMSEMQRG